MRIQWTSIIDKAAKTKNQLMGRQVRRSLQSKEHRDK